MRELKLYEDFSREEVHGIFSPETKFTRGSGTWGNHGIVAIPDRPGDCVFFVTFGQKQGEHEFDEGVTKEGVLSWQSQPRQDFDNPQIQDFINHDELRHSIYLFLRTSEDKDYAYLGKLKYLSHDEERTNPVYFQWQILDWNVASDVLSKMELETQMGEAPPEPPLPKNKIGEIIEQTPPPKPTIKKGKKTRDFRGRKSPDYADKDARNRDLGLAGEKLIFKYEKERLVNAGHEDLAGQVSHISVIEGDGAGYDIRSYNEDGSVRYIEVKTTKGDDMTGFYMSVNEVEFSDAHPNNYHLYRVYEYDKKTDTGKLYCVSGKVRELFELTPNNFRVRGPI